MCSRRFLSGALIVGVCIGFLTAGPVAAQSVSLGNGLIDLQDAQGDNVFYVSPGQMRLGATGADTDLVIYDGVAGDQALYFNTSLGNLYLGGADDGGTLYLRNLSSVTTVFADGANGDFALGGGTADGDLTIRDITGVTNLTVNGAAGNLTVGAHGVAGDAGTIYVRDSDGVTNTITLDGLGGNLELGTSGSVDDGDIDVWDGSGTRSFYVRGNAGDVFNKFTGNGLVKAWARINADGTVASCWRCSTSALNTGNISTGSYEVDFTIDANIDSRPVVCSPGHNGTGITLATSVSCVGRGGDDSSIFVVTQNGSGTAINSTFTAVVF